MILQDLPTAAQTHEHVKLSLETVTPVHIGGRTRLGSNRVLMTDNVRTIISENRLFEQLRRREAISDYFSAALDRDSDLSRFLRNYPWFNQSRDAFATAVSAYQLDWYQNYPLAQPSSIRPFIRDGRYQANIPGTAIKGAIRSAVLYEQLRRLKEEDTDDFNRVIQQLWNDIPNVPLKSTNPAIQVGLIEDMLQDYEVLVRDDCWVEPNEVSLRDFLKVLQVSDTMPVTENLKLCRVQWVSEGGTRGWHFSLSERNGNQFPTNVCVEVIPEQNALACDGMVDRFTIRRLRRRTSEANRCFSDFDSLLNLLRRFADDLLAFEKGFLQHLYDQAKDPHIKVAVREYERIEQEQPNLRIGWGSGTMSITILRLLLRDADMRMLDQPEIETIHERFFPPQHQWKYGSDIKYFPKTRRFIVRPTEDGSIDESDEAQWPLITPLGWCKLSRQGGGE